MTGPLHSFHAVAFAENFSLRELQPHYPEAIRKPHDLSFTASAGGSIFLFRFGAVVFMDVPPVAREAELLRLAQARPGATSTQVIQEEFTVREAAGERPDMDGGVLTLDRLTAERASVVALTVAQSAAMEYYERIVDQMYLDTARIVDVLEKHGTVSMRTRPLHRFIGAAVGTRSEVLSVLHLLDRPDALWDDPGADRIYEELRSEFDLLDRYQALERKLRGAQEALELVLGVARDRRLTLLEGSIVLLIVLELLISLVGHLTG